MRLVRIGIDVGGTFTDAVMLDEQTHDLLGQVKTPTTHSAPEGVALGIAKALGELLAAFDLAPDQVRFIAHGTTQATNALLEGDVAQVGIVATGAGLEGMRARSETVIEAVDLAPGKPLKSDTVFVESEAPAAALDAALASLRAGGATVLVAAAPFSVDDPAEEQKIMAAGTAAGMPAVGTHELTSLYGLRMRTRTAVVNACILPRMMETADMTEGSLRRVGIKAPLMVMRCDGGVMTVDEMRKRPILTVLSGPAAGVAGALLFERISRGIFLEVGGTSTDLSAVRDGRVMVEYAEIGGHKTYVSSLDVRTVGVAGGSMIRFDGRRIVDVGPRSAHIAGLDYAAFAAPERLCGLSLETCAPTPGDPPDYLVLRSAAGERFALTPACAATLLGVSRPGDYAYGSPEAARLGFAPLAAEMGVSPEEAARQALGIAAGKAAPTVEALLKRYELNRAETELVGGGGGAAAIVPFLAQKMGMRGRLARHHEVISPIGVALALVREVVERTIINPGSGDLLRIRKEAEEAAIRSGAAAGSLSVQIEIDPARGIVRAVASGATEMQARAAASARLSDQELLARAAEELGTQTAQRIAQIGRWHLFEAVKTERRLLWKHVRRMLRVLSGDGVVVLAREDAEMESGPVAQWMDLLESGLRRATRYGDAGAVLPETFLFCGARMVDLSGAVSREQMQALATSELAGFSPEEPLLVLCIRRK